MGGIAAIFVFRVAAAAAAAATVSFNDLAIVETSVVAVTCHPFHLSMTIVAASSHVDLPFRSIHSFPSMYSIYSSSNGCSGLTAAVSTGGGTVHAFLRVQQCAVP